MATKPVAAALAAVLLAAVVGCSARPGPVEAPIPPAAGPGSTSAANPPDAGTSAGPSAAATHAATRPATPAAAATPARTRPAPAPRRVAAPARFSLSIPAIGVGKLPVIPYTGEADDGPGTRIQNRGVAATPRGPRGGVGPGEVGNLIVTAHRTSAGGPFRRLPALRHGSHVLVTSRGQVYDYLVTGTMTISFRSARDRARQSAPVPGQLGRRATRPMITLSTCATPEDRAAGNLWTDEFGNLEHRIDKIGVLVAVRPA
jgi:sortase A